MKNRGLVRLTGTSVLNAPVRSSSVRDYTPDRELNYSEQFAPVPKLIYRMIAEMDSRSNELKDGRFVPPIWK